MSHVERYLDFHTTSPFVTVTLTQPMSLLSALSADVKHSTSPLSKLPVSLILLLNIFTHVVLTPDPVKDSDKDLDWPGAARKNTLGMIHDVCTGEGAQKEIIDCMSVTVTMRGLSVKMLNFLRTTFRYIDP